MGIQFAKKTLEEQEKLVHFGNDFFCFLVEDYNTENPLEDEKFVRDVSFTCHKGMYHKVVELFGIDGMYIPEDEDHFRFTAKTAVGQGLVTWLLENNGLVRVNGPQDVIDFIEDAKAQDFNNISV